MTDTEKAAKWKADRTIAWREAWIKLINNSGPDSLNGLACMTFDGEVIESIIASDTLDAFIDDKLSKERRKEILGIGNQDKQWLAFTPEEKEECLAFAIDDGVMELDISVQAIDDIVNSFVTCFENDEVFTDDDDDDDDDDLGGEEDE